MILIVMATLHLLNVVLLVMSTVTMGIVILRVLLVMRYLVARKMRMKNNFVVLRELVMRHLVKGR